MRGIGRGSLAAVMAAASLGVAASAGADEGPVVLGQQQRAPILTLDPFHGSLALSGLFANQSNTGSGQSLKSTDTLLQEQLTLATGGGIVSKNLVDWHASVTAGLNEESVQGQSSTGQTGSSFGYITAYDLSATMLKTTEFPVSVFAQQAQQYVSNSFAGLLQDTTSSYGARCSITSRPSCPLR